jgi:hypothetical protein
VLMGYLNRTVRIAIVLLTIDVCQLYGKALTRGPWVEAPLRATTVRKRVNAAPGDKLAHASPTDIKRSDETLITDCLQTGPRTGPGHNVVTDAEYLRRAINLARQPEVAVPHAIFRRRTKSDALVMTAGKEGRRETAFIFSSWSATGQKFLRRRGIVAVAAPCVEDFGTFF